MPSSLRAGSAKTKANVTRLNGGSFRPCCGRQMFASRYCRARPPFRKLRRERKREERFHWEPFDRLLVRRIDRNVGSMPEETKRPRQDSKHKVTSGPPGGPTGPIERAEDLCTETRDLLAFAMHAARKSAEFRGWLVSSPLKSASNNIAIFYVLRTMRTIRAIIVIISHL